MGADKSLPAGETIDAEMIELSKILQSAEFKQQQGEFFAKHCETFTNEEENKLEYTAIHQEYEAMVEATIKEKIGDEKLKKIEVGLKDYIKVDVNHKRSPEVYEAIEILSALGDFVEFKKIMLAKKSEIEGGGEAGKIGYVDKGVL